MNPASDLTEIDGVRMTRYLWIDTDPGIDDMFTIFVALSLYDEGIRVIGISTSFGNTNEEQCSKNLQQLLRAFKVCPKFKYIPKIYRGPSAPLDTSWKAGVKSDDELPIHGDNGLGDLEEEELRLKFPQIASQEPIPFESRSFISGIEEAISFCKSVDTPLTFVSIGPLTTLSLVSMIFKDDYRQGRILPIVMGGAVPDHIKLPDNELRLHARNEMLKYDAKLERGNMALYGSDEAEHNVFRDVHAAKNVLCDRTQGVPDIYLVDWCQTIASGIVVPGLEKAMTSTDSEFSQYLYRISKAYPDFSFYNNGDKFYMIVCDLIALWFGLFHSHMDGECKKRGLIEDMECSATQRGGITRFTEDPNGNVIVASFVPDKFLEEISVRIMTLMK